MANYIEKTDIDSKRFVTPSSRYRPDLVAAEAYGSTDFWWKIMEANNIKDVFNFKAGLNIIIPNVILR